MVPPDNMIQNSASMPTVVCQDIEKWASTRSAFSPMAFVAPPYVFPAMDEMSTIEQEEELRKKSLMASIRKNLEIERKLKSDQDSLDGSSTGSSEGIDVQEEVPKLTRKQIFLIVMLAFSNFCSTVAFSCIAPFFPGEASSKGASQTVIGLLFGVFELVIFLVSPLYGRYMTHFGSKNLYAGGLLVTGFTSILFGLLNLLPAGDIFIGCCFAVRIVEAAADASFMTASFALIAHEFPGRTSTIIGVLETFSGLGFTVGPPIGGALYTLGGFQTPFVLLGGLLIIAGILAIVFIPKQDDAPRHSVGNVFGIFRYPAVFILCFAIMSSAICLSYIDPTLQPHLESFNLSPMLIGFMFLAIGGVYTLTTPLWGYFVDKTIWSREVMIVGALLTMVGMFFIGPSDFLNLEKSIWVIVVAEILLGLGIGALFVPTFQNVMTVAREKGYPESYETYGLVSGLFQSCFSFGGFLGPTIFGGVVVGAIGFNKTATILAGLNLVVAILLTIYETYNRFSKKREYMDIEENQTTEALKRTSDSPDSGFGHETTVA